MKRYMRLRQRKPHNQASVVDPRFKALPFLSYDEKKETFARMVSEAATIKEVEVCVCTREVMHCHCQVCNHSSHLCSGVLRTFSSVLFMQVSLFPWDLSLLKEVIEKCFPLWLYISKHVNFKMYNTYVLYGPSFFFFFYFFLPSPPLVRTTHCTYILILCLCIWTY